MSWITKIVKWKEFIQTQGSESHEGCYDAVNITVHGFGLHPSTGFY